MITYSTQVITKKATKPLESISSLGFVMPFQPAMWDDKSIKSALNYGTHIIETTLKSNYSEECTKTMLGRLQLLFKMLNFNTHRKGIAVIISADSEKVFYLNYPVRFSVCTGNFISLLDLVDSIKQETSFYLLFICQENICLYEYTNEHLNKVYEQKPDAVSGYFVDAEVRATSVISYMNTNCQKPVFIVGNSEHLNAFQMAVPFSEIVFQIIQPLQQYSAEMLQSIITEIVEQWSYWLSKFDVGRIAMAKKANALVFNYDAVLKALYKSTDGLILMDKRVKKELQKHATDDIYSQGSDFFISQVERFLDRGNCIGIKQNGLLKEWGGIVLLPNSIPACDKTSYFGKNHISGGIGTLF
jgi:hypothetical protein